ncbi:hypothetical protein CDL12_24882 [Handroanthus impetiginosus]|uniref:Protein FLX-like 4 n=1 Tax=Handroanthus impetiginosus TaxID=429701 RepID=A0A2G9GBE8_9LAMI|nr:hypothetical protein CDL12_24882 [Handroanthus impetiginosus]
MAARRDIPPTREYVIQASETSRGLLPAVHHHMEPLPPPGLLENKLASQEAELEQLAVDNHKLSSLHIALRQDLVAAQREVEKLREHIRNIQTEGDVEISNLLDKNAKMEADARATDKIKKELQEAHLEAQSLVTAKLKLAAQVEQATQELGNARKEVKKLPEMDAKLDSLKQEHQRLRETFEYEKGVNIEKVEQLKIMEKDLIDLAEEAERLRAEVLIAEKKTSVPMPYSGQHMNFGNMYPPTFHINGGYVDSSAQPYFHMAGAPVEGPNPYANGGFVVGPPAIHGPPGSRAAGNPAWAGAYDAPHG